MVLKNAKIMAQNRFTTGVKMGRFNLHHGALIKALRYIIILLYYIILYYYIKFILFIYYHI